MSAIPLVFPLFDFIAYLASLSTLSPAQETVQKVTSTTHEAGIAAWQQVDRALTTPRCINCHTATNYPEQGDDRHRHLFNVVAVAGQVKACRA